MPAVLVDQVSKRFTLRHDRPRSYQELFVNLLHPKHIKSKEKHWALRDVSFKAEAGEMLGIIGENGAGKSTLLKLLARVIEPTSGQIEVKGRIGALLELGAGFHPDLTGRENVFLNGSILGLSKAEMRHLFDDIVSFSEMERFIDVPVKHYSSGMFMRLGFAVAIHLRPNVLLVDEVLAVGDEAFQRRCLDRINEVKRQGVTIIFVTHDLGKVRTMCDRAVWLDEGHIKAEGEVERVVDGYTFHAIAAEELIMRKAKPSPESEASWRWGSREAEIVAVQFLDEGGQEKHTFKTGQTFIARIYYSAHERIQDPQFGVAFYRADGYHISGPNTDFAGYSIEAIDEDGYIDYVIPEMPFLQGTYLFSASIYGDQGSHAYDHHHQAYTFHIVEGGQIKDQYGMLYIPSRWHLERVAAKGGAPDAQVPSK